MQQCNHCGEMIIAESCEKCGGMEEEPWKDDDYIFYTENPNTSEIIQEETY